MNTIEFSILVNLSLKLEGEMANVSIKDVELKPALISLPIKQKIEDTIPKGWERGRTLHDIILETVKDYISETGNETFSAADLYHFSKKKYPNLKRNSFNAHVIAAAPNHTSWQHYSTKKRYLYYLGNGKYKLKSVLEDNNSK